MKRVGFYLFLTLLTILVTLGISYHDVIFEAIRSFPKDWFLWYIIGTINTTLVFWVIPKQIIVKRKKKNSQTIEENE